VPYGYSFDMLLLMGTLERLVEQVLVSDRTPRTTVVLLQGLPPSWRKTAIAAKLAVD
jgi:hypothetical protein